MLYKEPVLCPGKHIMVKNNKCGHSLDYRHGARYHTWVVTSTCQQGRVLTVTGYRLLLLQKRCHRFECHAEEDVIAIGYSTLNTAAVISKCGYTTIFVAENIVLL